VKGIPITPKMGRILFSELADAVLADYKMNKTKSLDDTERRIYKRGPKKGKPIMVLKADAWFYDFRRTAIRNLERMGIPRSVAKVDGRAQRRIASVRGTMSRVSAIWMWPERRWNAARWNVSTQRRNLPQIHTPIRITLPVTGKV
jgi:hypothetical protein